MENKHKILIVAAIATIGIVGYFIYKRRKENMPENTNMPNNTNSASIPKSQQPGAMVVQAGDQTVEIEFLMENKPGATIFLHPVGAKTIFPMDVDSALANGVQPSTKNVLTVDSNYLSQFDHGPELLGGKKFAELFV